jgi:hypothetical protein
MTDDTAQARSEIILYQTEDGRTHIQCRFEGETLWLTQAQMAELFQTTPQNVTLHLKDIFAEGELDEVATCKPDLQVRQEGARAGDAQPAPLQPRRDPRRGLPRTDIVPSDRRPARLVVHQDRVAMQRKDVADHRWPACGLRRERFGAEGHHDVCVVYIEHYVA